MATLAGARYWDDDVMVAVVLGTGTNACYVEHVDAIPKMNGSDSMSGRTVYNTCVQFLNICYLFAFDIEIKFQIVNTEWGAFSNGLPLTEFDREMDAESINPGEQVKSSFSLSNFIHLLCMFNLLFI